VQTRPFESFQLTDIFRGTHPVLSSVVAALLIILGILIVVYPTILYWVVGIGLALTGIAIFAAVFATTQRTVR
jgi:hypothetical protein